MSLRRGSYGSSLPEARLLLLGNIGCGKTSTADTILKVLARVSGPEASRRCQLRQGDAEGRNVTLVEAPRWYWNGGKMEDSVKKETERGMEMLDAGPHAILLLVPVGQFTEMEGRVPAELEDLFGEEVLDHTLVLLTCGDYLMGRTAEDYLQRERPGLRQMIERCGGRYHVLNNRVRQDRQQVQELLEKVDGLVKEKGVFRIKTLQEREVERQVKQRKKEILESFRAQQEAQRTTTDSPAAPTTETPRREESYVSVLERRREEGSEAAGRTGASQVSNGLHSAPAPERQSDSDRQANRTPSFGLNADGARLSQISDAKTSPKIVSTFHHRINSSEERSPEASPTSSPRSSVFNPYSSSFAPTFAASSSLISSSSSSTSYLPSSSFSSPFSSSSSSPSSPPSSNQELRLVLLGRSGAGKSAVGNIILGRREFESLSDSLASITQQCEKKKAVVEGRRVAVVDTPDWFNSEQSPEEVRTQVSSCVALASPGPHSFLLCVPIDQPAKTEVKALQVLEKVFGPDAVNKYTLVIFTYGDRLKEIDKSGNGSVEEYIANQRGDLLKLVEKCGDRYHVMERRGGKGERRNVAEMLEKVEQTVKEAGGQYYSCPAFQEAESRVRQKQVELATKRLGQSPRHERVEDSDSRVLYSYMQPVSEGEEEVREDEMEKTRDEAERSVGAMNIESLPPITADTTQTSLLQAVVEKVGSAAKMVPKLLASSSAMIGQGAKKVKSSPVWGSVGSGAQSVQKTVADSSVWGKVGSTAGSVSKAVGSTAGSVSKAVGSTAGNVSKAVGDKVPKVMVDGSGWVGSGAKAVASSPVWGKVGSGAKSGAKIMADSSMRLGAGLGTGAKNLAQSPMWGKVGSGAKTGAKMMADGSMKVGAGIGAGAKKVAQSPVWGKVGSGAKAGAKMVADSSAWEKIRDTAKKVPPVVMLGAVLGLVLGVFLGGAVGGAVGAVAGSAATEAGRRKFGSKSTLEKTDDAVRNVERTINDGVDAALRHGEKVLKAE